MKKREWLIAYRKAKGLSQNDVAKAIGRKSSIYSAYEMGTRRPQPEVAKAIARIFGFEWTRFYEETSNQKESG